MVSASSILSVFAVASSAYAYNLNPIANEVSSVYVNKMAQFRASGVNEAQASAIAGHMFDAVATDKNVQAAIVKGLQSLVNERGKVIDASEVRSLVDTGASAFNNYIQEPAYTSLIKYFEKNYEQFDWIAMWQDARSSAGPIGTKAIDMFTKFYQDPNGHEAVKSMHSMAAHVLSDVATIH